MKLNVIANGLMMIALSSASACQDGFGNGGVKAEWESCGGANICINQQLEAGSPQYRGGLAARSLRSETDHLRFCDGGTCSSVKIVGAACSSDSECSSRVCKTHCVPIRSGYPGESCDVSNIHFCAGGYCHPTREVCVTYASEGQPCSPQLPTNNKTHLEIPYKNRIVSISLTEFPLCYRGIFYGETSPHEWIIREGFDPDYYLTAEPLQCIVTSNGQTSCIKLPEHKDNCLEVQSDNNILPGIQSIELLQRDNLGQNPGYCERGKYPLYHKGVCKCEKYQKEGKPCGFNDNNELLVHCEFGTICLSEAEVCTEIFDGNAGVAIPENLKGERSIISPDLWCPKDTYFNYETRDCRNVAATVCTTDIECSAGSDSRGQVICQKACAEPAGVCLIISSICRDELKGVIAFNLDRQPKKIVGSPYGSYMQSLNSLSLQYKKSKAYTCCLRSNVPLDSSLWYFLSLHEVNYAVTGVCSDDYPVVMVVIISVVMFGVGCVTAFIIYKDWIPSYKQLPDKE